jgi:hypothetical protein
MVRTLKEAIASPIKAPWSAHGVLMMPREGKNGRIAVREIKVHP